MDNLPLRDVQKVQLEILLEFDRICRKHDLKYILFGGTLLGAVRHSGFIPWDDDIDVGMLREDYDKFVALCPSELDPKYFLQTTESDKNYIFQFAKLRKNNTRFVEQTMAQLDIHHGIFIDVFPLDNVRPHTIGGLLQQKLLYALGRLNLTRVKGVCESVKNPILRSVSIFFHYIMRFVPKQWTDYSQRMLACMFLDRKTEYVSHLTNGVSKTRYYKY